LLFLLVCLIAAAPLSAQTGLGVVRGTVLDATGAAVPGAKLTLTNTATGVARGSETSGVGLYQFGAVPPGPYTLTVESAGFRKWSGTLTVEVGQTAVVNASLEVGTLEATVEVTGAAPIITTQGAEINDVKDALRIEQLPLNGRDVRNLFNLTPGVEGGGVPRVNGLKVGSADMLLDGISLVDRFGGGLRNGVSPGLDTIQEYRIETTGSGAQYSRPATVTLVTKSGTNELHGALFETHRNNFGGLRARQRQDLAVPYRPVQYIRNEYGGSAGGPIIKNKTFWFFSYEGQKLRQSRYAEAAVPTAAIWDGDFSGATDQSGEPITLYDPMTSTADGVRTPFAGNRIPSGRISEFSKTMRSVSAEPNQAGVDPWLGINFVTYYPNTTDYYSYTAKGDHVFSESDNISGRYTRTNWTNKLFGGRFGYPKPGSSDAGGTGRTIADVHSMFARWNHVFSPTLLNEFQASVNRAPKTGGTLADDTDWANRLGLPNPFGATGWPTIYGADHFFYYGGWDADNRKDENLTAFQLENNVTWIKGKHSIRMGFKGRQEYNNIRELQQTHGSHDFYSDWTALYDPEADAAKSYTGLGMGSILLGLPTYLSNQFNRGYFYFQQKEIGAYFHDSFRVSPKLTLELGVRWDKWTAYKEKYNRLVNVDLNSFANQFQVITPHSTRMEDIPGIPPAVLDSWAARGLSWRTADEAGFPGGLLPADNNNFGPRLGLAYRLTDKWVIRAGYGRYFWTMPLSQILQTSRTNPPLNLRFQNGIRTQDGRDETYALRNAPKANEHVGTAIVPTTGIVTLPSSAQQMMPWDVSRWSDNQADEWNFTLEREIIKDTALRLSYIGNHGSNLEQRFAINSVESEWNYQARTGQARPSTTDLRRANRNWNFLAANHTGFSNTHSLQANVDRRYSNGLSFQWFYTFSRVLTTSDAGGFTSGNGGINSVGGDTFMVPENIQILGAPNLSYDERLRLGYYNSREVPAHRIRWNGIYTLPFGRGKQIAGGASKGLNVLVGGWEVAFIGDWRSGQWMGVANNRFLFGDPTLDADERLVMTYDGRTRRLWFAGDMEPSRATGVDAAKLQQLVPLDRSQRVVRPLGTAFDNRLPQQLADGSVRLTTITDNVNWNARNFFRGPGAWNQDFSVFKHFDLTEKVKLRFTADFFNVFNHPNEGDPNTTTGLQDLTVQTNDPRIVQFSLRVSF
jgi:hypothetical protein